MPWEWRRARDPFGWLKNLIAFVGLLVALAVIVMVLAG